MISVPMLQAVDIESSMHAIGDIASVISGNHDNNVNMKAIKSYGAYVRSI